MLDWVKNLFSNKDDSENFEWRTDSSIFNFLADNLNEEGKLTEPGFDLPDEKPANENELRFAPGLLDSMLGAQDSTNSKLEIDELVQLIKRVSEYGDRRSEAKFYQLVTATDSVIGIIDDFLDRAAKLSLPINPYLLNFSKDLAFKTDHRNSVKFGVAMIGMCGDKSLTNQIKIIGLHDEFTLFAIVALSGFSDNLINDLWALAKKVEGWGKIHAVERLAKMELPNDIKNWLITDGYKNSIMYEYLAYTCALNGELHNIIKKETISNTIFESSTEIITALINGGPAEDISVYQYAAVLIENYIRHATVQASDVSVFIMLTDIKEFLIELQNDDIANQSKNGWTQDIISNCLIDTMEIINAKNWSEFVVPALQSNDNTLFWKGKQAAKILNIDIWNIVWQRLKNDPSDSSLWYDVVNEAKPEQADEVINYAIETLPLNELATGPKDSLGIGPEYARHQALDFIITFLEGFPTKGELILLSALDSPVTRNRHMAVKALQKWGKANWSEGIAIKLRHLSKIEPDEDTKKNILRVLKGQDLSY